nr:MAG TPA: hypothetical protein [Caudoviricetes sp.]
MNRSCLICKFKSYQSHNHLCKLLTKINVSPKF